MKTKTITYWISTTLLACDATAAGVFYLAHAPFVVEAFAHMGYPVYFLNILGVAQLLGAFALLVPGRVTVKEWAYAGFGITYISGFISHVVTGDGPEALEPLVVFTVLTMSYLTRPAGR
jgi:hypothetical protein